MTNKRLILAIFLAGALWRVFLFVGLCNYDDFAYTNIALDMLDGRFHFLTADNRYAWRFLLTAPTALAFLFCGAREWSAIFFPFFCSLGNIIVVWLIGRELFNENVGLLAAALAAVFPNSVVYGTMLFPEEILSFFAGMAFLFFLWTESERIKPVHGYLLAGVFIAFAFAARETGAFLMPLFFLMSKRKKSLPISLLFLPMIVYFSVEMIVSLWATGDPLHHYSQLQQTFQILFAEHQQTYAADTYIVSLFGGNLYGLAHFGLYYPFFVLSVFYLTLKKKIAPAKPLLLWMAVYFLYYQFGSTSITHYVPLAKVLRFISILTMPLLLILSYSFLEIYAAGRWRKAVFVVILAVIMATSLIGAVKASAKHRQYFQEEGGVEKYYRIVNDIETKRPRRVITAARIEKYRLSYFWAASHGRETRPEIAYAGERSALQNGRE